MLAGLLALHDDGAVELAIDSSPSRVSPDPLTSSFDVTRLIDNRTRRVVTDLRDQSDVFSESLFDTCDVYYKRSFFRPDVERLAAPKKAKVRPFGLNYGCTSSRSRNLVTRRAWLQFIRPILKSGRDLPSSLKRLWQAGRIYYSLPDVAEFEQGPRVRLEPAVTFQTRVWAPEKTTEDLDAVNRGRVELVRALKTAFGSQFRGGLVPTPFASSRYPDLLANLPSRRSEYIQSSKKSLIGIYTVGLHGSTAFKLPEYLAASQCIVSEPIRNEPPSPLVSGTNYLDFRAPDECVSRCKTLLNDLTRAQQMREANHAYFRSEVAPQFHMLRCLERAFVDCGGTVPPAIETPVERL